MRKFELSNQSHQGLIKGANMKSSRIFRTVRTFINLCSHRTWSHSSSIVASSTNQVLPLLTSRVAYLDHVHKYSDGINIGSLLDKVELEGNSYPKRGRKEDHQTLHDPNIELRIRSRKRQFLQKNVYKRSHFSVLTSGDEQAHQPDNSFRESDNDLETDQKHSAGSMPDLKEEIPASQDLQVQLENLNISQISEDDPWGLFCKLLQDRCVPRKSVLADLRGYCHKNLSAWGVDTILQVLDWWHLMGKMDSPTFSLALCELSSRDDLQAHQLVQIFYLISIYKEVPNDVSSLFVRRIEQITQGLDWSELCIVCEGFLKCRPGIKSQSFAREILCRIQASAHKPDSAYQLVTVLRFLSRSYERDYGTLQKIAEVMTPVIHSSDFVAVPHIAAAFAKLRCYHHNMFAAVTERTMASLESPDSMKSHLRPKGIWMLLWAYGRLNYLPPDEGFIDTLVDHLRRSETASLRYPLQHVKSMVSLCFLDIYPVDLIERTFDGVFLKACEDLNFPDIYKQLVILDNSVAIDRPEYDGNRLPKEFRERSLQVPHGTTGYTLERRNETRSLVETITRAAGGKEYVRTMPILPHIRTPGDIEVDLSRKVLPHISVENHRQMMPEPLPPHSQRIAVIYQLKSNYRFSPRKLLGVHVMKKRQLQRLGYKVVEVPYFEWQPMTQQSEKRQARYIKKKINGAAEGKQMED